MSTKGYRFCGEARPGNRWVKAALILVALVLLPVLGAAGTLYVQGARGVCATEDSVSCVWFGPWQGNGRGRVVVNGPE